MLSNQVQKLECENSILRAQVEELQRIYGDRAGLPKNCEYCRNFIPHYTKIGSVYVRLSYGHCVAGKRTKNKTAEETCKYFVEREL